MPNIDKVKKTKSKKKTNSNLPVAKKTPTAAKDVIAYYNCLLTQASQN
jgi:hypothetical protein